MRRVAAMLAALILASALAGCAPSAEQLACERDGGTWTSYVAGYTYIYVNKVMVPQPIILSRCDPNQPNGGQ